MMNILEFAIKKTVSSLHHKISTLADKEYIILVDENDHETGKMEKLEAHKKGLLHRAFSVFIFNSKSELLLQQRALAKYHSGGLWTNTCCSHPNYGEKTEDAVKRRLKEEMGLTCETKFLFHFTYKSELKEGLTEHEFDHVFYGISDDKPVLNHEEVADWRYITLDELQNEIKESPDQFTVWLKICLPKVIEKWAEIKPKIQNLG